MSKRKKMAILIASHLLAVTVGLAAAFLWFSLYIRRTLEGANAMMTQAAIISRYSAFVDVQRTNAGPEEYREALKSFLSAVDEAAKHPSPFFDRKLLAMDKALTYERLSRLEREAGNSREAEEHMKSAVATCGHTGWKDCSPENISRISKKLEGAGLGSQGKEWGKKN